MAESRYQGTETKHLPCEVCRQFFSPRRTSARFCSSKCRQRAHRRASRLSLDEINAHSQHNVDKSAQGPSGSAEVVGKPPPPVTQTAAHQPAVASNSSALSSTPYLVQDQRFPNMWRTAFPDGRHSNMVNITRAKDALALAKRRRDQTPHELGRRSKPAHVRARESKATGERPYMELAPAPTEPRGSSGLIAPRGRPIY